MPDPRREKVYELLDALREEVGALQAAAFHARDVDSAYWLACAEDAIAEFVEAFDDRVDAHEERRWVRQQEADLEDGVSGAMRLAYLAEAGRSVK